MAALPPLLFALLLQTAQVPPLETVPESADPCLDQRVTVVALAECDADICREQVTRTRLVSLTDLAPGATLDERRLNTARARLVATGFFQDVEIRCRPAGGGGTPS